MRCGVTSVKTLQATMMITVLVGGCDADVGIGDMSMELVVMIINGLHGS